MFKSEADFEKAVIKKLTEHGWSRKKFQYLNEKDLLDHWAEILYKNNKGIDRLNGQPLTEGEKQQLLEQIKILKTPAALNKFINGKSIAIKRDNPKDPAHLGKEVSLFIYDREQIAGGKSVYEIVKQPVFPSQNAMKTSSRGDLMLLINGMPLIHIELKRSGVPISQATEQIKRYAKKGVFTGLFSLVQVFVAMSPEECRYFANPGDGDFNDKFFFKWADSNNKPYTSWDKIIVHLLSIPMAHKLIGFYTVPDDGDGVLKVLRSYQYYAVEAIAHRVDKAQWTERDRLGGYVWHTTGSGKTMTSFKAAQLLANSRKCDKVVFLMDRIELGVQSVKEYRNFADEREEIQETENSRDLIAKLKSNDISNTLIVTSIQKMSKLKSDNGFNKHDIDLVANKKIVFIIDECHRSTFGDMLADIKATFPRALYFGFTGTPIFDENQKKNNTQTDLFGNELHRYSIADGIRDGNVLPFYTKKITTFKDNIVRKEVALHESNASDVKEAQSNPRKSKIFNYYMYEAPMVGKKNVDGTYTKGIEDFINPAQYERDETKDIKKQHQYQVVKNILEDWEITSVANKYHAIFATSSIKEAVQYYRLFKDMMGKNNLPTIKITCLFDDSIDNDGGATDKEDAIVEILTDYNKLYNKKYTLPNYVYFKKDVSARLAHKDRYFHFEDIDKEHLDLLIVVDQMLTGYDSKWVNTLYLDKKLKNEAIVQAFSRTNRINDSQKPFGIIKYYRYPNTMEFNIVAAFNLYSGNKPRGIFVDKLNDNINTIRDLYEQIESVFYNAGISNFAKLPDNDAEKGKFASLFSKLNKTLIAAKLQGFQWSKADKEYKLRLDEKTYLILAMRYKELFNNVGNQSLEGAAFDIDATCIEINTDKIDAEYLDSQFKKYIKEIQENRKDSEKAINLYGDIHRNFASLSQEEQRFAEQIIFDLQNGELFAEDDKSFRDYLNEYMEKSKNDQIHKFAVNLGYDEDILRELVEKRPTAANIDAFGQLEPLRNSFDVETAKKYFEKKDGVKLSTIRAEASADNLVREFIIKGGFDI